MTNRQKQPLKMLTYVFIMFLLTLGSTVNTQEDGVAPTSDSLNTHPRSNDGGGSHNENTVTTAVPVMAPGAGAGVPDPSSVVSGTNSGGVGQRAGGEMPQGSGVGAGGGNVGLSDVSNSDSSSSTSTPLSRPSDAQDPSSDNMGSNGIPNNKLLHGNLAAEVTTHPSDILMGADASKSSHDLDSKKETLDSPVGYSSGEWSPVPKSELVDRKELTVLYSMSNGFLEMIQPKTLNELEDLFDFQDPEKTKENLSKNIPRILLYFIGFSICIGIGVLLLLCVPFAGSIVCCCRCCGNCGGKGSHRDTRSSECSRCCCGFLLFSFLAIVLSGGIIMVFLSTDIQARLSGDDSVFDDVSQGFETLARYGNQTLAEMRVATVEKYQVANEEAFSHLEGILPEVNQQLGAEAYLNDMATFSGSLADMRDATDQIYELLTNFTSSKDEADRQISDIKSIATDLMLSCNESCNAAKDAIGNLTTKADFSGINPSQLKTVLENAIIYGMDHKVKTAQAKYVSETSKVNDSISSEITKAKNISHDIEQRMNSFIQDLNDEIKINDIQKMADSVDKLKEEGTEGNIPYLKIPGWSLLGLAILCIVLAACYFMGLAFGTMCKRPKEGKSQCCSWKTGACWLLTGIALTFIFYFFLMLVLIVLFASGGAVHTEACRHLYNLPNSTLTGFVDKAIQANVKNFSVSISETYRDCAHNKSIYTAFKLEENGINLTKILNTVDVNKAIDDIKRIEINIGNLDLFDKDEKTAITTLGEQMDAAVNDIEDWLKLTEEDITTIPLAKVASKLKEAAEFTDDPPALVEQSEKLENLSIGLIASMEQQKQDLQSTVKKLNDLVTAVNLTITFKSLLDRIDVINDNGTVITQVIVNRTADTVHGLISGTITGVETDVKDNVGRCEPVYGALSTVVNSGCVTLLSSINAYWFCLAMVLIPMIFVIISAFKLVSLYRKTIPHNSLEAIDNSLYMSAFNEQDHRARGPAKKDQEMLLKPMNRTRSDYLAMADNPVFQDDELPYAIPRAVIRTGRPVLPVHPADPDDAYYYAMPRSRSPPPKYSTSSTGF